MPVRGNNYFPRAKAARRILQEKYEQIVKDHLATIDEARVAGEFEVAIKAQQWLIEHGKDDDGTSIVDPSVDKNKVGEQPAGPSIQIGFALGGLTPANQQVQLPAAQQVEDGDIVAEVDDKSKV